MTTTDAVLNHFVTGFDQIRVTLKELLDEPNEATLRNNSLIHKVQIERNKLAHQKGELTGEGKMLLHGEKQAMEYNYDEFQRLRKELLEAHSNISQLSK